MPQQRNDTHLAAEIGHRLDRAAQQRFRMRRDEAGDLQNLRGQRVGIDEERHAGRDEGQERNQRDHDLKADRSREGWQIVVANPACCQHRDTQPAVLLHPGQTALHLRDQFLYPPAGRPGFPARPQRPAAQDAAASRERAGGSRQASTAALTPPSPR